MFIRVAGAGLASGAIACGADADNAVSDCSQGACMFDSGTDRRKDDGPPPPPLDGSLPEAELTRNPLCGTVGCFPGNPSACGPPVMVDGAYGYAPLLQADAFGAQQADAGEDGTDADAAHGDGSMTDGGTSDASKPPQSCYIQRSEADGGVVTACMAIGSRGAGDNCSDSSDCGVIPETGASLACVDTHRKVTCRQVSCGLPIACPVHTYYETAPLRVAGVTQPDFKVPVCLPADNCILFAACPDPNEVCAVVNGEGETSCIVPGRAKLGEWCDDANRCGQGLLCSGLTNKCLQICHIGSPSGSECSGGGTCQGGIRSVPVGFGICVGQTDGG